jgi:hypothetical protein
VRRRFYLTTLLAAGAAVATLGPASIADANPCSGYCAAHSDQGANDLVQTAMPVRPMGTPSHPSMAQLPSSSHVLPIVDVSGVPIRHP